MKAIDEEITYRKQLRKEDFRQDVDKLKLQKMVQRKDERLSQDLTRDKQLQEEAFMQHILQQKRQLILQAIHSLGLDSQDLPKGTGIDKLE